MFRAFGRKLIRPCFPLDRPASVADAETEHDSGVDVMPEFSTGSTVYEEQVVSQ